MEQIFIAIADGLVGICNLILYIFMFQPRYKKKPTRIIMVLGAFVMTIIYNISVYEFQVNSVRASLYAMTIPSMILFYILSKYRDGRFILIFCMVDVTCLMVAFISRCVGWFAGRNPFLVLFIEVLLLALVFLMVKPFLKSLNKVMELLNEGWELIALMSVLFYAMLDVIMGYPTPINERKEYIPVCLLICAVILVSYVVIFRTMEQMHKIHEDEKNQKFMKAQLEIQANQLELKELYYKMAYIDALTELKNRAAFNKTINEFMNNKDVYGKVYCISFDINNLKTVNDSQGHHMGDKLIQSAAKVLLDVFQDQERVFRIGGDEFAVIIYNGSEEIVIKKLDILDKTIEEENKKNSFNLSISVGYELFNHKGHGDLYKTFIEADKNMYENKRKFKEQGCY